MEPAIVSLAFSPDNRWLAALYENGQVNLFDRDTLEPSFTIQTGWESIWHGRLAFDPDGEWIAVSSISEDTIELWETASQELLATLQTPTEPVDSQGVWDIAIRDDGQYLAGVGMESVHVWDIEDQSLIISSTCRNQDIGAITFSPDGRYLAAGCEGQMLHVWDTTSWSEVAVLDSEVTVTSMNFSPENPILEAATHIQAGGSGMFAPITLWDTKSWEVVLVLSGEQSLDTAIGTDGSVLANVSLWNKLTLWSTTTGDELFVSHNHFDTHITTFSPDGRLLVTGCPDGSIRWWGVH
jgi:WD40 repeat protein